MSATPPAVRTWLAAPLLLGACSQGEPRVQASTPATLVHLGELLPSARIVSAPSPASARAAREFRFEQPEPGWHVHPPAGEAGATAVTATQLDDALRLALAPGPAPEGMLIGGLMLELEQALPPEACTGLLVRARTHMRLGGITACYNLDERQAIPGPFFFFMSPEGSAPVFNDGSVQSYLLPLRLRPGSREIRSLGVFTGAPGPASLDILSVTLVPHGADFLADHGSRPVTRAGETRSTLFAHTPATLAFPLRVPAGGRLDLGLTTLPGETVTYRMSLRTSDTLLLLEEEVSASSSWEQRSLDLSGWAGREGELLLEARSARDGAVALWGAPIVSGSGGARRPNVVFYVIDGGGADLMSLYGYNRRTTPFLERLAGEAVVFERAYSNSTWTQSSTASFMTGLQHSVLGGLRRGVHSTPVPAAAVTMAEHMRRGGYLTASFTSNPNAGRLIGLERGLDVMRDVETEHHSTSSRDLHEWFWRFREHYPGAPCWVHFQTTDVHEPNEPEPPFAGLYVSRQERAQLDTWDRKLFEAAGELFGTTSIAEFYDQALERAQIDRQAYYNVRRGLYDETMAYQDRELGRFVDELKQRGEWEHTLLIVAADHGHPAGTFARFGRGLFEPRPESWQGALFDSWSTRVPLLFSWPERLEGGRRIERAVSMIDVLPTVLDLLGLEPPRVCQGRSLAALLLGQDLPHEPVFLDEFRVDQESDELVGNIEVVDGRWGASLELGPTPSGSAPELGRHAIPAGGRWGAVHPFFPEVPRLLLYDLKNDPFARRAVNEREPELVEHYRALLLERWQAHLALAQSFGEAGEAALAPDQLQQLQALGYIR
jgi:arylsulfatase A-like enzyme